MSLDPSAELQASVFALLSAGLSVPVYDRVPTSAGRPYVVIGDDHIMSEYYGGEVFSDAYVQVHVWSDVPGSIEAKTIGGQVRAILDAPIAITGFRVSEYEHVDTRVMGDGLTSHVIVQLHYLIQPLA